MPAFDNRHINNLDATAPRISRDKRISAVILFGNRRDARHAAMAAFPTQPPQEPASATRCLVVEVEIDGGIGVLRNPIIAES
jgi:hypothetical protein